MLTIEAQNKTTLVYFDTQGTTPVYRTSTWCHVKVCRPMAVL